MSFVKNLIMRVGADVNPLQKDLKKAKTSVSSFNKYYADSSKKVTQSGKDMGGAFLWAKLKMVAFAAAAATALYKVGKASISNAMNVVESENLFIVSLGSMRNAARAWSEDLQTTLGLNGYEIRKNIGLFYNMTTAMGLTRDQAYKVSTGITQLAYDMSSFYNISFDEMFIKIQAGLSGEIEPLRRIGVIVNETATKTWAYAHGIGTLGKELTESQKVLARYGLIMEQTTNAQGDMARTIKSPLNQLRILQAQLKLASINLGQAFMPLVEVVLPILVEFAKKLVTIIGLIAQFTRSLGGVADYGYSAGESAADAAAAQAELGEEIKKTDAAIKGSLAGFDEINQLTEDMTDSAGDAADGDTTIPGISKAEDPGTGLIPQSVLDAADAFKSKLADIVAFGQRMGEIFGPVLQSAFDKMKPVVAGFKTSFELIFDGITKWGNPLKNWFMTDLIPYWQKSIYIAGDIVAGLSDTFLKVFNGIVFAVQPVLDWFVIVGLPTLTEFASGAADVFWAMFRTAKTIFDTIWDEAIRPGMELATDNLIDGLAILNGAWDKWGQGIITGLTAAFENIRVIFQNLWEKFLKPIVDTMLNTMSWLWDKHLSGLWKQITEFIGKLVTGVLDLWNRVIAPFINWIVEHFGPTFRNIFQTIIDIFGTVFAVVSDVVKGILKALGGIIDFVVGIFTGDWKRAWTGIKDIFGGIFEGLAAPFKGIINLIIDLINSLIRAFNIMPEKFSKVPGFEWVANMKINEIPKLERGGIISTPTLAEVGHGPEAIVPLENTSFVDAMATAVGNAVAGATRISTGSNTNSGSQEIIVQIDSVKVARILLPAIEKEKARTGPAILQGV